MLNITEEQLQLLHDFSFGSDMTDFQNVFGERLGEHLWNKFSIKYSFSILDLWSTLDSDNRKKLVDSINQYAKDISYKPGHLK